MSNWAIYGALIAGFVAGSLAIAHLVVRTRAAWRALKRLQAGLGHELLEVADRGDAMADRMEAATDNERLESSLSQLRVDLARFAVLRQALDEAQDTFKRFALVYPRK